MLISLILNFFKKRRLFFLYKKRKSIDKCDLCWYDTNARITKLLKNNPNKSHINVLISDTTEFVGESNMNNAPKCLKGNLLIKHLI